ncbi:MAG: hypothetical protein AAF671_09295, partial [Pseudomonadota bacterium]
WIQTGEFRTRAIRFQVAGLPAKTMANAKRVVSSPQARVGLRVRDLGPYLALLERPGTPLLPLAP